MHVTRKIKVILIVLDGLGDRTYEVLGHRTPLAAAATPNLDKLARMGANGSYHAGVPGQCLPSENAHFLMFGYDMAAFPGRGFLESAGFGVPCGDKDVAILAHLCRVRFSGGIPHLEYGRDEITGTRDELAPLYERLTPYETNGAVLELHHTRRNEAILVARGNVSPDISDSDPIYTHAPVGRIVPLAESTDPLLAKKTADYMNQYLAWCCRRLKGVKAAGKSKDPAVRGNFLVTQRAGRRVDQQLFSDKWGFSPAMIASGGLFKGIAMTLGFDFSEAADTGAPGGDLAERIRMALDDEAHDFVHVHTKVPDEVSHNGTPELKTEVIAALDGGFAGLLKVLGKREDLLAVITADHSTPACSGLVHSGETVPVIMAGTAIRRDRVDRFDEIAAVTGSLGFLRGAELMHMVLNCTDRAILEGLRLGAVRRPFLRVDYPLFVTAPAVKRGRKQEPLPE